MIADWRITASRVEFDRTKDAGTARNAWLEFKGQRVFYLPWISFPLSSQRKSGFLAPTYGTDRSGGVEVTAPYYFNLAPNYDATLTARAMRERGVQAQGEFRFVSRAYGSGQVAAHYLPFDAKFDDDRTAFDLAHQHRWSDRWSTDTRFEWVSDAEYLEDLGASLSQSSRTHLPRRFDARYRGDGWGALVRFQEFLTVDRTILAQNRPYARLPQILVQTKSSGEKPGAELRRNGGTHVFRSTIAHHRGTCGPAAVSHLSNPHRRDLHGAEGGGTLHPVQSEPDRGRGDQGRRPVRECFRASVSTAACSSSVPSPSTTDH